MAEANAPARVATTVTIGPVSHANDLPLVIIAGPCQMESRDHAFECASALKEMASAAGIGLIYKTSVDKANRASLGGERGIGLSKAIDVFGELREVAVRPSRQGAAERTGLAVQGQSRS